MEIADSEVPITIPKAKGLRCTVDFRSLSRDSFIVAKASAAIEAEDEITAFEEAQTALVQTDSRDTAWLASAQQCAQALLEDCIFNIGKATGKTTL